MPIVGGLWTNDNTFRLIVPQHFSSNLAEKRGNGVPVSPIRLASGNAVAVELVICRIDGLFAETDQIEHCNGPVLRQTHQSGKLRTRRIHGHCLHRLEKMEEGPFLPLFVIVFGLRPEKSQLAKAVFVFWGKANLGMKAGTDSAKAGAEALHEDEL